MTPRKTGEIQISGSNYAILIYTRPGLKKSSGNLSWGVIEIMEYSPLVVTLQ